MAKKKSFADEAKTIMNKYKPRLGEKFDKGDVLALEAMNQELAGLRDKQEKERVQELIKNANTEQLSQLSQALQQPQGNQGPQQPGIPQGGPSGLAGGQAPQATGQPQFQGGGSLQTARQQGLEGIKGSFGNTSMLQGLFPQDSTQPVPLPQPQFGNPQGVQPVPLPQPNIRNINPYMNEQARQVQEGERPLFLNPSSVQPDTTNVFATGGNLLPVYQGPGELPQYLAQPVNRGQRTGFFAPTYTDQPNLGQGSQGSDFIWNDPNAYDPSTNQYQQDLAQGYGSVGGIEPQANPGVIASPDSPFPQVEGPSRAKQWWQGLASQQGDPYNSRVPWWAHAASGAAGIIGNRNIDFDQNRIKPQQITPQTVSFAREREQLQRDRDIANATIRGGQGTGGSRAKLSQRLQAGATGTQRNLGRGLSTSFQNEGNINAQIRNRAGEFNAQQRSIADRLNFQYDREGQLINEQRRGQRWASGLGALTDYGMDINRANQFDVMAQMATPDNYRFQAGRGDTPLRRILGMTQPGEMVQSSYTDITGDPLQEKSVYGV